MSAIKNWFRKLWVTCWLRANSYCFEHMPEAVGMCWKCYDRHITRKKEAERKRAEYPEKMIAILKGRNLK
jgi:hypothetical protein